MGHCRTSDAPALYMCQHSTSAVSVQCSRKTDAVSIGAAPFGVHQDPPKSDSGAPISQRSPGGPSPRSSRLSSRRSRATLWSTSGCPVELALKTCCLPRTHATTMSADCGLRLIDRCACRPSPLTNNMLVWRATRSSESLRCAPGLPRSSRTSSSVAVRVSRFAIPSLRRLTLRALASPRMWGLRRERRRARMRERELDPCVTLRRTIANMRRPCGWRRSYAAGAVPTRATPRRWMCTSEWGEMRTRASGSVASFPGWVHTALGRATGCRDRGTRSAVLRYSWAASCGEVLVRSPRGVRVWTNSGATGT